MEHYTETPSSILKMEVIDIFLCNIGTVYQSPQHHTVEDVLSYCLLFKYIT